jgi:1-phosphatidylinositol phosphodiesterase
VKKLFRSSAYVGILAAVLAAASVALATSASASTTDAYSHDSTIGASNPAWMSWLSSNASLSELSIPGTHDSGASRAGGNIVLTQSMSLPEQLKSGIRAWDIRLGQDADGRLKIYHGIIQQGQDFETDVLAVASGFLDAYPSETILMRVKHDNGPDTGFDTLVKAGLDKFPRVYTGTSDNPVLGDIRGKIVVLQDFSSSTRMGIPWGSLAIQDNYKMGTNWDLADKWRAIKAQLDAAQRGPRTTTYVNFLSGSGGSFPYFVASGHFGPETGAPNLLTGMTRGVINTCSGNSQCIPEFPSVNCFLGTCSVAFEGTNILTRNEINGRARPDRFGVIMADFPGAGLVQAVISANDYSAFRSVLRGPQSGRCLDVPASTQQNSTQVELWDCQGGSNQIWAATPFGQLTVYGTKCLDVRSNGTADGTPVQIYDCNGTGAQRWVSLSNGSIANPDAGKCLDVSAHGTTNGSPIVIWTCNGSASQKWVRS